jgi:two-component system sensor histidine kinase TctE
VINPLALLARLSGMPRRFAQRLKSTRAGRWLDHRLGARPPEAYSGVLGDLLATRESNRPLRRGGRQWGRRAGDRVVAPAPEQRSLFGEILDWMMVPLLLLWPLSVAITFIVARSIADAPYDRALQDKLRLLSQQVRYVEGTPQIVMGSGARTILRAEDEDPVFFQFVGPTGEVMLGESELPAPALYDFPEPGVTKLRMETFKGDEVRVAYVYVDAPQPEHAGRLVLVQIAETQDKRARLANEIIKGVILPQFLILPLALGLVWFGLGRGLGPLKSLQEGIRARRPDDLSPIDPRGVPQEMSPLVDAFNELLARLGHTVNRQKRFIADAAHQMKTPLAGLRTQAELALREPDPAQLRLSLEQLARGSARSAHLISQLLALARTENQRDQAVLEHLDLNPLARAVATDWADKAIDRSIDFGLETDDQPAPIAGQAILLRELMNNLIDNALCYTPHGGRVTARVRSDGTDVVFEVEDNGPGIPPAERGLVFERFYRVLGTGIDGSGLGLAIVQEIAEQHDALVSIHDATPGQDPPGARLEVRFPKPAEH